jgi:hypothetical protein
MMLCNKLDICHHYEISSEQLDNFVQDATSRGIETNYDPANGSIKNVAKDGHYLLLCNGGDFQGILFKNTDDPKLVPKINK